MPRKSLEVLVNPAILKWARESAGWTAEEISEKLKINAATIQEWETLEKPLSLKMLERLAKYFKRPLAAFFLPEPPTESPMPTDFRVLPGKQGSFSKETRLAVRRTKRLQAIAAELADNLGLKLKAKISRASLDDKAEKIALGERKRLGVDIQAQFGWKDAFEAFKVWRDKVESLNVLVFQIRMPIDDARGFSLTEKEPPAIVVNSSDAIHARIFTLFHEYAHILLQKPGICIPDNEFPKTDDERRIEKWCHQFSGAFLLPEEILRSDDDLRIIAQGSEFSSELLGKVSRRFKVSSQVILIRMRTLGLISENLSENLYRQEIVSLQSQVGKISQPPRFGPPPARRCLQEKGRLFISLVLESKDREFINYSDIADYLSIRLDHLEKLQSLVRPSVNAEKYIRH